MLLFTFVILLLLLYESFKLLKFLKISNNFFFFSYSLFSSSFLFFIFFFLINSFNSSDFLKFFLLAKGKSSLFSVSFSWNWIVVYFFVFGSFISNILFSKELILLFSFGFLELLCRKESLILEDVDKFLFNCLLLWLDPTSIWIGNFLCSLWIFCINSNDFTGGFNCFFLFFVISKVNFSSSFEFNKLL